MEYTTIPDTLVLKISELKNFKINSSLTTLYIIYDVKLETYIIRGEKTFVETYDKLNYSFECDTATCLVDFIKLIFGKCELLYTIYNYNNLPLLSDDITFDFLEKHDDYINIIGEEVGPTKKNYLKNKLKMLKWIFNFNQ